LYAYRSFDPEYRLVASTWSKLPDKSRLFFGIVDFKTGKTIFEKLNMNSAPGVIFFPATNSEDYRYSSDAYDFNTR
jgi:oligosaccharyltransferase complex subunit gamma